MKANRYPAIAAVITASIFATIFGPPAHAQATTAPATPDGVVVNQGRPIGVPPVNGTATVIIPAPPGLTVDRLVGSLELGAPAGSGLVRFRANGTLVATYDTNNLRLGRNDLAVPLTGVVPDQDGNIVVTVENLLRGASNGDLCAAELLPDLRLSSLRVIQSGTPAPPDTVASFFPAGVQAITIITPANPSADESQAALTATAGLTARHPGARVRVAPGEIPSGFDPWKRTVTMAETSTGQPASVTLSNVDGRLALDLRGSAADLNAAAEALSAPQSALATGTNAQPVTVERAGVGYGKQSVPIVDLASGPVQLRGIGTLRRDIGIRQDSFGGGVREFAVNLNLIHTPIVAEQAGTASLWWNNQMIASADLAKSGTDRVTLNATVPPTLVGRDNSLALVVDVTGTTGNCQSGSLPFTASITPDSVVAATPGWSVAPGFQRWPQVAAGTFNVSFPGADAQHVPTGHLSAAGDIIHALQRHASAPTTVKLVPFPAFQSGTDPGIVVGADEATARNLGAPLPLTPFRGLTVGATTGGFEVHGPYGAIEAFEVDGRNVLLAGAHGDDRALPKLTDDLAGSDDGWAALDGALRVKALGREAVNLDGAEWSMPEAAPIESNRRELPLPVLVLIVAVILLFVARTLVAHRRRRRLAAGAAAARESRRHHETAGSEPDGAGSDRTTP